ncbi:MAG: molybdopterin molybdotransferase MoeA [Gemmatimonadaceae bacterium]|nr:molybdopterin molybdotransferase MoeA [Gemmatimonadaceae bacterium]
MTARGPRLPVEEAVARILRTAEDCAVAWESVPVREAAGRVLQETIEARHTHPAWRNSAMDGYAVHADDVRGATAESPVTLPVAGTIAAGDRAPGAVPRGTAWRIMTGAPVPDGIDSVVRVEDTDAGALQVTIRSDRDAGANIRPRGEDFMQGQPLLSAGDTLRAPHVAIAAAAGRSAVRVARRPRIAILTSGNELVDVDRFDEVLAGQRIIDTNGYALAAAIEEAGGEPVDLGIARDDPAAIAERITGAPPFDALVTCGGISVGAFDYTRDVVQRLGATLDFWRVRMRPGGPFGFGLLGGRPWFGLPGNPVSALVTFEVFVRPALRIMGRHGVTERSAVAVRLASPVTTAGGLTHFLRAVVDEDGVAHLTGPQGSGMLTSMVAATALLIVPHDVSYLPAGATVRALLLVPGFFPQRAVPWTY